MSEEVRQLYSHAGWEECWQHSCVPVWQLLRNKYHWHPGDYQKAQAAFFKSGIENKRATIIMVPVFSSSCLPSNMVRYFSCRWHWQDKRTRHNSWSVPKALHVEKEPIDRAKGRRQLSLLRSHNRSVCNKEQTTETIERVRIVVNFLRHWGIMIDGCFKRGIVRWFGHDRKDLKQYETRVWKCQENFLCPKKEGKKCCKWRAHSLMSLAYAFYG